MSTDKAVERLKEIVESNDWEQYEDEVKEIITTAVKEALEKVVRGILHERNLFGCVCDFKKDECAFCVEKRKLTSIIDTALKQEGE